MTTLTLITSLLSLALLLFIVVTLRKSQKGLSELKAQMEISENETLELFEKLAFHQKEQFTAIVMALRENEKESCANCDEDGEDDTDDDLYAEAKRIVIEAEQASTSYLQRKLGVGYARAARLMDKLEEGGVIGPSKGAARRAVIMTLEQIEADEEE
jgi:S-DNA-T family DNA segregation ATPase FtsK/SpoIIIE